MTPRDLGLPFDEFRAGQLGTACSLDESISYATIFRAPPGTGKTLTYMTAAQLGALRSSGAFRTCVLTSTKRLQDQIYTDFQPTGMVDVRGKANYPCHEIQGLQCDDITAPCNHGEHCARKATTCAYYATVRKATTAGSIVTSYAFYLNRALHGQDLGTFDLLVCDEAHLALDWLTNVLSFSLMPKHVKDLSGMELEITDDADLLRVWAYAAIDALRTEYVKCKKDRVRQQNITALGQNLGRFLHDSVEWVLDADKHGVNLRPVNPGHVFSHFLWQHARKVVLCSATVYREDAMMLGLNDVVEITVPSTFPAERRPVILYDKAPAILMSHRTTDEELAIIVDRIDNVVESMPEQKGIVQCTSYWQAQRIKKMSRMAGRMLVADRNRSQLRLFTQSTNGVLVSPTVKEGVDFPHDACRFVIFPKVPFPHTGDKLTKARTELYKQHGIKYIDHLAVRSFVQMSLRAMRAHDDYCLIVLLDGHFDQWLVRVADHFEPWFTEAISVTDTLPTLENVTQ